MNNCLLTSIGFDLDNEDAGGAMMLQDKNSNAVVVARHNLVVVAVTR